MPPFGGVHFGALCCKGRVVRVNGSVKYAPFIQHGCRGAITPYWENVCFCKRFRLE